MKIKTLIGTSLLALSLALGATGCAGTGAPTGGWGIAAGSSHIGSLRGT